MSIKSEIEEGLRQGLRAHAASLITDGQGLSHSRISSEVERLRAASRMLQSIIEEAFKENEN